MEGKVRLTFEVTPELNAVLDRLAERYGSKTEVFRKAIGLIEVAAEAKTAGDKLVIADKHRRPKTELVGL
jgi:predicted transcriptional regulator